MGVNSCVHVWHIFLPYVFIKKTDLYKNTKIQQNDTRAIAISHVFGDDNV